MDGKILSATVVGFERGFYEVDAPDAPSYLRPLFLRAWQMHGAAVGQNISIQFQVTARSGLWNVIEVEEERS